MNVIKQYKLSKPMTDALNLVADGKWIAVPTVTACALIDRGLITPLAKETDYTHQLTDLGREAHAAIATEPAKTQPVTGLTERTIIKREKLSPVMVEAILYAPTTFAPKSDGTPAIDGIVYCSTKTEAALVARGIMHPTESTLTSKGRQIVTDILADRADRKRTAERVAEIRAAYAEKPEITITPEEVGYTSNGDETKAEPVDEWFALASQALANSDAPRPVVVVGDPMEPGNLSEQIRGGGVLFIPDGPTCGIANGHDHPEIPGFVITPLSVVADRVESDEWDGHAGQLGPNATNAVPDATLQRRDERLRYAKSIAWDVSHPDGDDKPAPWGLTHVRRFAETGSVHADAMMREIRNHMVRAARGAGGASWELQEAGNRLAELGWLHAWVMERGVVDSLGWQDRDRIGNGWDQVELYPLDEADELPAWADWSDQSRAVCSAVIAPASQWEPAEHCGDAVSREEFHGTVEDGPFCPVHRQTWDAAQDEPW